MKPVICNHGNNEAFVSLIKSPCSPGGTWSMFVWKSKGTDGVCSNTFFLESRLWLPSIHLSSEERGTSSGFLLKSNVPASVSREALSRLFTCDDEVTTNTNRRRRPHETRRYSECVWKWCRDMDIFMEENEKRGNGNRRGKQMGSSHKCVHVLKSYAFIINGGNHRRLLIGDALVGVSEVSGVLSVSICKLPRLGENRQDVTLSCVPPVDSEGCNLNLSFSSHRSLWLAAKTPGLEHTNSGTAVWESPQLVSGMESKWHNMQMTGSIVLTVNHQKVNQLKA